MPSFFKRIKSKTTPSSHSDTQQGISSHKVSPPPCPVPKLASKAKVKAKGKGKGKSKAKRNDTWSSDGESSWSCHGDPIVQGELRHSHGWDGQLYEDPTETTHQSHVSALPDQSQEGDSPSYWSHQAALAESYRSPARVHSPTRSESQPNNLLTHSTSSSLLSTLTHASSVPTVSTLNTSSSSSSTCSSFLQSQPPTPARLDPRIKLQGDLRTSTSLATFQFPLTAVPLTSTPFSRTRANTDKPLPRSPNQSSFGRLKHKPDSERVQASNPSVSRSPTIQDEGIIGGSGEGDDGRENLDDVWAMFLEETQSILTAAGSNRRPSDDSEHGLAYLDLGEDGQVEELTSQEDPIDNLPIPTSISSASFLDHLDFSHFPTPPSASIRPYITPPSLPLTSPHHSTARLHSQSSARRSPRHHHLSISSLASVSTVDAPSPETPLLVLPPHYTIEQKGTTLYRDESFSQHKHEHVDYQAVEDGDALAEESWGQAL